MIKFYIPHKLNNEKIILLLKRHWFIIFTKILFWAIAALMPFLLYVVVKNTFGNLLENDFIHPIILLFTSTYYLFVWLFAFHSFVDYYLDVWIVTNERIVNIEQKGLFSREISEQKLYRIQDITSEIKGIFPTILDYGTVYIQTAGEEQRFIFKEVPNPQEVAKKVIKIVEQHKKFNKLLETEDKITIKKTK